MFFVTGVIFLTDFEFDPQPMMRDGLQLCSYGCALAIQMGLSDGATALQTNTRKQNAELRMERLFIAFSRQVSLDWRPISIKGCQKGLWRLPWFHIAAKAH